MFSYILMLAAAVLVPKPVMIEADANHYFGADAFTGAQYLHLAADGSYRAVDVEHMFTEVRDTGRWHVDGLRLLLESDHAVRDIDLGEFTVLVFDRCGQETLPELRVALKKIRDRDKPVSPEELDKVQVTRIGHPLGRGPRGMCGASVSYLPDEYPATPVPPERLDQVLSAIDAWLADAETNNIFEYEALEYRGERFLVPMRAGMHAVQLSAGEVQEAMDSAPDALAPYVYYRISAKEYEKRAGCTYAFKFHTEMNAPCNAE